jgi:hypothetical protein
MLCPLLAGQRRARSGHCGEPVAGQSMANLNEVHHSLCPPLTCTVSPVRKAASCVARNATTAAISSAFPIATQDVAFDHGV